MVICVRRHTVVLNLLAVVAFLLQEDLSIHAPDSEHQQAVVSAIADHDAFNWGYDPVHYGVPEGGYSTHPDSTLRVLEYREMVQVSR